MLCRRLNKILFTRSSIYHSSQYRCFIISRSKCSCINTVFAALKTDPMSSYTLRLILRDLSVTRLWNAWFRTQLVSSMVKRCRRDRGVRDMLVCFRQTILRPSRTFLLSATAACKSSIDDRKPEPCQRNITEEELEELTKAFDGVDELSRTTLFCEGCKHRLVIDKKHPGVKYCVCPNTQPPGASEDGWVPYMEAEDVVIWRKEYKPGGLYAYKVYGRYNDLTANTFATIQLDGAYRRSWDDAVAALAVVERDANGVRAQSVLHWEVAWPRLFSNRDYVYIRRHKEFDVVTKCLAHKEAIFRPDDPDPCAEERPSVHTRAKRKAVEHERREARVAQGAIEKKNKPGMEFVLTYYDEPSVGGLPGGVSAWATGRAAPRYLARMRRAAAAYRRRRVRQEELDFEPFGSEAAPADEVKKPEMRDDIKPAPAAPPAAPVLSADKSTQTNDLPTETSPQVVPLTPRPHTALPLTGVLTEVKAEVKAPVETKKDSSDAVEVDTELDSCGPPEKGNGAERSEAQTNESDGERKTSWWRYLYPFYYFV